MKCFACRELGHYDSKFPNKRKGKRKKHVVATIEVDEMDEFSVRFDENFSLIICLLSCVSYSGWYIDNGASSHMTGVSSILLDTSEVDSGCSMSCGANIRLATSRVGSMMFQVELGGTLRVA